MKEGREVQENDTYEKSNIGVRIEYISINSTSL